MLNLLQNFFGRLELKKIENSRRGKNSPPTTKDSTSIFDNIRLSCILEIQVYVFFTESMQCEFYVIHFLSLEFRFWALFPAVLIRNTTLTNFPIALEIEFAI